MIRCDGKTDLCCHGSNRRKALGGETVSRTVSLSAQASDDVSVSKVEFYVDGALHSTVKLACSRQTNGRPRRGVRVGELRRFYGQVRCRSEESAPDNSRARQP